MSKKGGAALQKDAPWRAAVKPIPKIHHSPVLRVPQSPFSDYAIYVMRNPNPVGNGLAVAAALEGAGPECIVPGQAKPIKLLGLKMISEEIAYSGNAQTVWPIEVDLKFLEPVGRELQRIGRLMEVAMDLMQKAFDNH